MPSGNQIRLVCSGLVCRSSSACLKYQMFQAKVDSSKAQVAVPGRRLLRCAASGQVRIRVNSTNSPRAQTAGYGEVRRTCEPGCAVPLGEGVSELRMAA